MKIFNFNEYISESLNINTAGIFLFNDNGEVLICKPTGSNLWSIPKGQQDHGENTYMTAKRELYEETNIDLDSAFVVVHKVIPLKTYKYKKTNKTLIPYVVYTTFLKEPILKCNSFFTTKRGKQLPEMEEYRWVSLKVAKTMIHEAQVRCIEDNLRFLKTISILHKDLENKKVSL